MNAARMIRRLGAVAGMLLAAGALAAEPEFGPPRLGATLKGDAVNQVGVAGAKAWLLDALAVEGAYIGVGGDFSGYAVRGIFLVPAGLPAGSATIRPYLTAGYADIEQELSISGSRLEVAGETIRWGVAGGGKVACRGSGLQVSCGVQANPFRRFSRLYLEAELLYSLFEVEGRGTSVVEGLGDLAPFAADAEITVESDFNALSLLLGLTVYF